MSKPNFTSGIIDSASIGAVFAAIGVTMYLIGHAIKHKTERERHARIFTR